MTLDWVSDPVSAEAPAGEDLFENDDVAYGDYYFDSVGRLPETNDFFQPGMEVGGNKTPDTIFDAKSVSFHTEAETIDALLRRSRDLRLLVLRAQWAILSGDLVSCVESVEALSQLLIDMPNDAHPCVNGSPRDRVEAINDLAQLGSMVLPLRYLDLAASGTSLRKILVARGKYTAHDGEHDIMLDPLLKALASSGEGLDNVSALIGRFTKSLEAVELSCLGHDMPHTPRLQILKTELSDINALLAEVRPNLAADVPTRDPDMEESEPDTPGWNTGSSGDVKTAAAAEVHSHSEARQRLVAVEVYFSRREPSSAAVLLVTQARLLIGKSLIEAFEVLMPNSVDRAAVEFTSAFDFKLARGQLRVLADQVEVGDGSLSEQSQSAEGEISEMTKASSPISESPRLFAIQNPNDVKAQIFAVEAYFRKVEISSPIPILLARARGYIGKDFEALMRELIPSEDY